MAIDLVTLRKVTIARGGSRGDVIVALADGRLLLSQSNQVDVVIPIAPPVVVATNPPADSYVALPLSLISVVFDQDMMAGDPNNLGSVTNPDNYSVVAADGTAAVIRQVIYDSKNRTALIQLDNLTGGVYTLRIEDGLRSAVDVPMRTEYTSRFTAVSDFTALVEIEFENSRLNRLDGTISYEVRVTNTQSYDLLLPLLLVLDPSHDYRGVPRNAAGRMDDGRWLISLEQSVPGGFRLRSGESTVGQTVTIASPDSLRVDFGHGISTLATVNLVPVFETPPVDAAVAGSAYSYDVVATDPDGTVVSYLLYDGPNGMSIDALSGALVWDVPTTVPAEVPVRIHAIDSRGGWSPQQWTISVQGGNRAPTLSGLPSRLTTVEGQRRVLRVRATDPEDDTLTYWAEGLPAGVTFDNRTAALYWSPSFESAGLYPSVEIFVSDGINVTRETIDLEVLPSDRPPQLTTPRLGPSARVM